MMRESERGGLDRVVRLDRLDWLVYLLPPGLFDKIGAPLSDYHGDCMRVAGGRLLHHRSVHHAKVGHSENPELIVHHFANRTHTHLERNGQVEF